jgi:hypothetical protein
LLRTRSVRRRHGLVGILAVTGAVFAPGTAHAAAFDNIVPVLRPGDVTPSGCGAGDLSICLTDNSAVYYYMDSSGEFELEADDKSDVRDVLSSEYSPTHLAIHYDSNPVFEGGGETDIVYQEGSKGLDDDADGMAWCNAKGNETWECDQQYVRIRGGTGNSGTYRNSGLICHETGHAVGLVHGVHANPPVGNENDGLGCMQTPVNSGERLGSNNRENINSVYPAP